MIVVVPRAFDVAVHDMNGDSIDDLLVWSKEFVGGSGGVSVFYGPIDRTPKSLDRADVFIVAPGIEDEGGRFAVGDVDGDGRADIAFGTPNAGDANEGRVTLVRSPL
jgi:hypothetical protein